MPRPLTVLPVWSLRGEVRVTQPDFSAAALITAAWRAFLRYFRRNCDRIGADRGRDLVDERLACEMELRSDRIAQMRGAQRRGAVEQRRDRLPQRALVGELVGFRRHAEHVLGLQRHAEEMAGERALGPRLVGLHVPREKPLLENS